MEYRKFLDIIDNTTCWLSWLSSRTFYVVVAKASRHLPYLTLPPSVVSIQERAPSRKLYAATAACYPSVDRRRQTLTQRQTLSYNLHLVVIVYLAFSADCGSFVWYRFSTAFSFYTVLHLLYARVWHKVLFDIGVVDHTEPFTKLVHQGMVCIVCLFIASCCPA